MPIATCWLIAIAGCGTTTQRMATEQLLMSDAVDQAVSQMDFGSLAGQKVYLDTTYLKPVKGFGFVNADYIVSSLRQQLTSARCLVQESREEADIVVEPRVGALGTDGHEVTYGLPQTGSITTAATVFSGSPPIPAIPEISFGRVDAQAGIAKVIVFAYDRQTRQPVWQSGVAKSESTSSNTWVLGAGPFQKGSVYSGTRFAGQKLKGGDNRDPAPASQVTFDQPHMFPSSQTIERQIANAADEKPAKDGPDSKGDEPKKSEDTVKWANHED